ncbi:MAG: bifunctional phosphopantothenoylcysteine decarboxylase/phosphopantothenate--cysteine ligase CoaBC [Acidimicrobiales bacterium]
MSLPLAGKRVVLGVTGGIAAYKSVEVCRRLIDLGAHVAPILTTSASRMIGESTFRALASEPPKSSIFDDADPSPHTTLGQGADLVLVCPATARILSDARSGRSADLLAATLLATEAPVLMAPAMHTEMWEHPAVQENLTVLASRGVHFVGPDEGPLAGGDIGRGRLAAPADVVAAAAAILMPTVPDLAGRRVLVTAGGTREALDPVRFIGNRSSGKQGYALAAEAAARGAEVVLVTTVDREPAPGVERVDVVTAAEMEAAVLDRAADCDAVIMAAAVADFRPVAVATSKIKKGDGVPTIELERTTDILAALGAAKPVGQVLVGFAAETDDLAANAVGKLERKRADYIVGNDVGAPGVGFGHDTNAVTIFGSDGTATEVALSDKGEIARAVLDVVAAALTT